MHISASPSKVPQNYHFTRGPWGLGVDFDIKRICLGEGMCGKLSPPGIYLLRWGGLEKDGGRAASAARLCHGRSGIGRHEPALAQLCNATYYYGHKGYV